MNYTEKKKLIFNYLDDFNSEDFAYWNHLYCFSTENLSGYFDEKLLKDKNVLLTGSSACQILMAQLYGAKSITHFDLNPYTKYLYELKVAAIKELELNEFLDFFYFDYQNNSSFSFDYYLVIRNSLKGESLDFWDDLFNNYSSYELRTRLFFVDEEIQDRASYEKYLSYLSYDNYNKLRQLSEFVKVDFIESDILSLSSKLDRKYDLIYFSNISSRFEMQSIYNSNKYIKNLYSFMRKILEYVEENGVVLLNYLYNSSLDTFFDKSQHYIHYMSFPIRFFNCQENIIFFETPTVCSYHGCEKDLVIGYQKKKLVNGKDSYSFVTSRPKE